MTAPLPTLRAAAERRGQARVEYVRPIVIRGWPTLMDLRVAARRARDAGDVDTTALFERFIDSRLKRAREQLARDRKLEEALAGPANGGREPLRSNLPASPRASREAS